MKSMIKSLIKGILILPGTVAVFIPALILYLAYIFSGNAIVISENIFLLIVSICFFVIGFLLAGWTTLLFYRIGNGTLAPWDPPKILVIKGPYQYVRNPMIVGMFCILLGETVLFFSVSLFLWVIIFFIANEVYIPFVEEKALLKRFEKDYDLYTKHVRRWIPRLTPWK